MFLTSGDTKQGLNKQGLNKQGLANAVFARFMVAKPLKQSRNMACLNLVETAFWGTLFDRPCDALKMYFD